MKHIFDWKAHVLIFARSELSWVLELLLSFTFEDKDVSYAKTLHVEVNPAGKSLVKIKNRSGPRTEPCGTPA